MFFSLATHAKEADPGVTAMTLRAASVQLGFGLDTSGRDELQLIDGPAFANAMPGFDCDLLAASYFTGDGARGRHGVLEGYGFSMRHGITFSTKSWRPC